MMTMQQLEDVKLIKFNLIFVQVAIFQAHQNSTLLHLYLLQLNYYITESGVSVNVKSPVKLLQRADLCSLFYMCR
jgi:hypothetical protein